MTISQAQASVAGTFQTGTTNATVTAGSAVASGDLIVAITFIKDISNLSFSLSDSLGNTYTKQVGYNGADFALRVDTAPVTSTGTPTITANKGGNSGTALVYFYNLTGWDGTTVPDGAAVTIERSDTDSSITMNATSQTSFLLCGIVSWYNGLDGIVFGNAASGWTNDLATDTGSSGSIQAKTEFRISASGSYTGGWPSMTNPHPRSYDAFAIAIKGSASATSANRIMFPPQTSAMGVGGVQGGNRVD